MTKTKIYAVLLAGAICISLAGCGNMAPVSESETVQVNAEETADETSGIDISDVISAEPTAPEESEPTAEASASEPQQPQEPEPVPDEPEPIPTEPEPTQPAQPEFDVSYWVSYAKSYAQSIGLELDSEAVSCWDNPIIASANSKYLERDLCGMLDKYSRDADITAVWIWAEPRTDTSWDIYIGYA